MGTDFGEIFDELEAIKRSVGEDAVSALNLVIQTLEEADAARSIAEKAEAVEDASRKLKQIEGLSAEHLTTIEGVTSRLDRFAARLWELKESVRSRI